jgi:hypothetical protein
VSIRKPDPMGMDMMYHYMKHRQPLTHMPDTVINSLGIWGNRYNHSYTYTIAPSNLRYCIYLLHAAMICFIA